MGRRNCWTGGGPTDKEGKRGDMRMIKKEGGRREKNAGLEEAEEKEGEYE